MNTGIQDAVALLGSLNGRPLGASVGALRAWK
jgi:hypothetical protein